MAHHETLHHRTTRTTTTITSNNNTDSTSSTQTQRRNMIMGVRDKGHASVQTYQSHSHTYIFDACRKPHHILVCVALGRGLMHGKKKKKK